ncbi:sensor histidine kinase [Paracoccus litorisediminis]|uniref:GAF domain-containing protein n=1 Tax=Paracoccus litorisediminis TaxID=2006130 RepID=A0A844HVU1_9RHOB|nr:histidine kinase dimerization/phosphoacceptor domain -containing protein [Paracoccus litorisediminis]MTH62584.1 GAF domain-containing protein [Paracoccus litorisediminis]
MKAETHTQQTQRLKALRSYGILDTDFETEFDEIVELASAICGTPISVINLIDAERQWFKSEVGLGVRETPLETSICAHAILQDDFTEIEDTALDTRMADNPLCAGDTGLRFYAGALLKTPEGLPLGTLCVLDHRPRRLSSHQKNALRVLARQVMVQLELRRELEASRMFRLEVDHRVKNSLQSLSSLVRIQMRSLREPEAIAAIASVKSRVDAISTMHELLYKTERSSHIDLGQYLASICAQLSALAPPRLTIIPKLISIDVSSDQAVAVGTLVNELVLNAFKHAFPQGKAGLVSISLEAIGQGRVRVTSSDNGRGLELMPTAGSSGLGMKIAQLAAAELGTEITFSNNDPGLRVSFEFLPDSA